MTNAAPEYIAARSVLLDVLEALALHRPSLVLVGAQAIYQRTGVVDATGIQFTTDSDLVLDVDLLSDNPELTEALKAANFTPVREDLPGQWQGAHGIRVDLMTVPHQSNRPAGKRAADLTPHGKESARITPGLEAALIDNTTLTIEALGEGDTRAIDLRVAGPAALLTAKLIKLAERQRDVNARRGNPARLKQKDALDCYRLLVVVPTQEMVSGFESHRAGPEAMAVTRAGLEFFATQRQLGDKGTLRALLAEALPGDLTALASLDALSDDLLEAMSEDFRTTDA